MPTEIGWNERNLIHLPDSVSGHRIDPYSTDATPRFAPGTFYAGESRKAWCYAWAGASALLRATMQQSEVPLASYLVDQVQTAYGVAAGQTRFKVLVSTGSSLTPAKLIGGTLVVEELGTGDIGDIYTIAQASWYTSDTVLLIDVLQPIRNAIAATAKLTLIKNRFVDTIDVPTSAQTAPAVGIPLVGVTAGYGYWSQVRGVAPLMLDTAIVPGNPVGIGASTAGYGGPAAGAVVGTTSVVTIKNIWGIAVQAGAGNKAGLIDLNLPY